MAAKAKTERMEFRAEEENLWRIRRAAVWSHEHVSEFVRAALQRAQDVERQHLVTFMEPDQFDALMDSLDVADEAPRLAAAVRKPAVFKRR